MDFIGGKLKCGNVKTGENNGEMCVDEKGENRGESSGDIGKNPSRRGAAKSQKRRGGGALGGKNWTGWTATG
jgi:hypothetical protein